MAWHHPPVRHSWQSAATSQRHCSSSRSHLSIPPQSALIRPVHAKLGPEHKVNMLCTRDQEVSMQLLDALLTSQRERWQHLTASEVWLLLMD